MSETIEHSDLRSGYKTVQLGPREIAIPTEWQDVRFEEAIEVSPRYEKPDSGTFDFLPMDAVDEEKQTIEYWTERDKSDCTTTWFKNGDTVYAKITPSTENGKIAFVDSLETEVGSGSTEFLVFHPVEAVTDEKFAYYLANLPDFRAVTISLMEGSTGRQRVPSDVFEQSLHIPLPPLAEQRRIANILSTVDEKIIQTDEIIEESKNLKKGLTQDLFQNGIGHSAFISASIGAREYQLPKSWEIVEVETLLDKETDKKPIRGGPPGGKISKKDRVDEGPKVYVQENIIYRDYSMGEEYLTQKKYEELKAAALEPGDVVITRAGTIGRTDVFPDSAREGIMDSSLIRLKVNQQKVQPEFLATYISDSSIAEFQIESMSHGGTRTNINNQIIKSLKIPLPPIEEQDKIMEVLGLAQKNVEEEQETKRELKDLKYGLMQDLLTGRKRVKSD
jgi:type I restriction enzyme S subunit